MRLYLVRHAKAEPGEPDELRRLTPGGRDTARAVGRRLADEGVRPSVVLTSPLLRARETADEIARASNAAVETVDSLGPGATPEDVQAAVAGRGEHVVVVGHQPDCGIAAAALGSGEAPAFPPGGLAVIDLA